MLPSMWPSRRFSFISCRDHSLRYSHCGRVERYFTVPLLDVTHGDHAGHVLEPVGQQIAGAGLAEDVLAVGEASAARTQVDLQDLDLAVLVVHVLHRNDAVETELLDDLSDVPDDLVVRVRDLLGGCDLLADHPLEKLAVDAECVDAQLLAGKHLHDKEALHAFPAFSNAEFALEGLGADLARQRVCQEVGVGSDLPEATAIDTPRGLDANALPSLEAGVDLLHGLLRADGLDTLRAVLAASHPGRKGDFVVHHVEGLGLADRKDRYSRDVRQVVHSRRKRPERIDAVLVHELLEAGYGFGLATIEVGQIDDFEAVLFSEVGRRAGQDELDTRTHRSSDEAVHAVGESGQDSRLCHDGPLRV